MKILITFSLLFLLVHTGFSQSYSFYPPESIHCQLNIDEIILQQEFDIDDPVSEDARVIIFELWAYLDDYYVGKSENNDEMTIQAISDIEKAKAKADGMGLNLSMFTSDFEVVSAN